MIMDWGRSCYRSVMQVVTPPGAPYLMPIRWFFAPPGAKEFSGLSAFTSGNWDQEKIALPPQLGEQPPYGRPWYSGENQWGYVGQCMVGTPEQFATGITEAEAYGPSRPEISLPTCCRIPPPPPIDAGGVGNGIAILGPNPLTSVGGISLGGPIPHVFGANGVGGLAIGGEAASTWYQTSLGGLAFAGSVESWPQLSVAGGLAFGGVEDHGLVEFPSGGLAFGGSVQAFEPVFMSGGFALGGTEPAFPPTVAESGGIKFGGEALRLNLEVLGGLALGGLVEANFSTGFVQGGIKLGGSDALPDPTWWSCASCSGGTSWLWRLDVVGGTGDFADFNGSWFFGDPSGCTWSAMGADNPWDTISIAGGPIVYATSLVLGSGAFANYAGLDPSGCTVSQLLTLQLSSGTGTPPTSVTAYPL